MATESSPVRQHWANPRASCQFQGLICSFLIGHLQAKVGRQIDHLLLASKHAMDKTLAVA